MADPNSEFDRQPAGRAVGPGLTPAQLLFQPWFQTPRVVTVPPTFTKFPATVKLFALDHARARSQSAVLPVMAVLPPNGMTGFWYTIELRRTGNRYDQGIGGTNRPPEGLVVHSYTPEGRVRYEGVLPLSAGDANRAWTSVARLFTLRLGDVGPNNEWPEPEGQRRHQRHCHEQHGTGDDGRVDERLDRVRGSYRPSRSDPVCW